MEKNMKIDHEMGDIDHDREYILTLKDRGVLDEEDEGDAMLENVELQSTFRQRMSQKKKQQSIDFKSNKRISADGILSKYDDVEETEQKSRKLIDLSAEHKASVPQKESLGNEDNE